MTTPADQLDAAAGAAVALPHLPPIPVALEAGAATSLLGFVASTEDVLQQAVAAFVAFVYVAGMFARLGHRVIDELERRRQAEAAAASPDDVETDAGEVR